MVASWRVHYNLDEKPLFHLDFRRSVAICLLKMHHTDRAQLGGGPIPNMPDNVRYDGVGHDKFPATLRKCKWCKKYCRYECIKCGVRLHYDKGAVCVTLYHRREQLLACKAWSKLFTWSYTLPLVLHFNCW